jgi:hypothetical protein
VRTVEPVRTQIGTAVLVEGVSDQRAVQALAARYGRDLDAEGIAVIPMGGATNVRRFLDRLGPAGAGVRLAGLCDAREARALCAGLARTGFGPVADRSELAALGFFVCELDLEDELIRALGVRAVEQVIESQGEVASLRILQQQPAQRGRTPEQQLRRFLGSRAGRKIRYAPLLVDALDLSHVPPSLERLLEHI